MSPLLFVMILRILKPLKSLVILLPLSRLCWLSPKSPKGDFHDTTIIRIASLLTYSHTHCVIASLFSYALRHCEPILIRFASLRGRRTKQSRKRIEIEGKLDSCVASGKPISFGLHPRNDVIQCLKARPIPNRF